MEEVFKFLYKFVANHVSVFIQTFSAPSLLLRPNVSDFNKDRRIKVYTISPDLIVFALLNLGVGVVLNSALLLRSLNQTQLITLIPVAFVLWIFFSILTHMFLVLFSQRINIIDILSLILQVQSVNYVVSNFMAFGLSIFVVLLQPNDFLEPYQTFIRFPIFSFYLFELILLIRGFRLLFLSIRVKWLPRVFISAIIPVFWVSTSFLFTFLPYLKPSEEFKAPNIVVQPPKLTMETPPIVKATVEPLRSITPTLIFHIQPTTPFITPTYTPTIIFNVDTLTPSPTYNPTHWVEMQPYISCEMVYFALQNNSGRDVSVRSEIRNDAGNIVTKYEQHILQPENYTGIGLDEEFLSGYSGILYVKIQFFDLDTNKVLDTYEHQVHINCR